MGRIGSGVRVSASFKKNPEGSVHKAAKKLSYDVLSDGLTSRRIVTLLTNTNIYFHSERRLTITA